MRKLNIIEDDNGNKVVLIPDILFSGKKKIDWKKVEEYLGKYVGNIIEITETKDVIFIGKKFPDEYSVSKYSQNVKGARAKAKANAVQGIREMVEIATEKIYKENIKEKHDSNAGKGWYYYTTRFAIPIYEGEKKTDQYNIYKGRMVVNHTLTGKNIYMILWILKKKKHAHHIRLRSRQVVKTVSSFSL